MAKEHDYQPDELGLEHDTPTDCKKSVIYHDVMDPETHTDEYATDGSVLRNQHGVQHSFPAGERYGGDKGSGKKFPGSEGDGLYGKMHKRNK